MDTKKLADEIARAVADYIADEELYDDNAQVVVDPVSGTVRLIDGDEDVDNVNLDVYDVMDLVRMNGDGVWEPDIEAIADALA